MLQAYNPSIVCAEKKFAGMRFEKNKSKGWRKPTPLSSAFYGVSFNGR